MSDFFELRARKTTVGREVRGAVATFLTMAYILFANPSILAAAGVPFEAAVAATAAAAGVCCLLMGLGANFPLALAPGMGLNAVIAFQVAAAAGSWQTAMGLVVLDGLVVLLLVIAGLREAVMHAIPHDLRRAIAAGIGLFIAFIGAVNAKLVIVPIGTVLTLTKNPAATLPPVTHGVLGSVEPAIALFGLIVIAFLLYRRVAGAIILGIAAATVVAIVVGFSSLPSGAWVGRAAIRHDVPGRHRGRAEPAPAAAAAVAGDGRLLRHDRHGHGDRRSRGDRHGVEHVRYVGTPESVRAAFRGCARFWRSMRSARRLAACSAQAR